MGLIELRKKYNNYIYCYNHYTMTLGEGQPETFMRVDSCSNVNKVINE